MPHRVPATQDLQHYLIISHIFVPPIFSHIKAATLSLRRGCIAASCCYRNLYIPIRNKAGTMRLGMVVDN